MNKQNIKNIVLITAIVIAALAVLVVLAGVEKKRAHYEKWGELAVLAETDERALFITENEELYTESMIEFYYDFPEELDFVYNYAFHKDDYASMKFTDEELNSEGIPALYMFDKRWGYESMGGYYIRAMGCMSVSLTMANLYLNHNTDIDPVKVARIAEKNEAVGLLGGLSNEKMPAVLNELGFKYAQHDFTDDRTKNATVDIELIREITENGRVCIACMRGETFGTHAIIIREVTDDGKLYINDPNSAENTAKEWNFDEIEKELCYIWELSK